MSKNPASAARPGAGDAPALPAIVDRARWQGEIGKPRVREKAHTRQGDEIWFTGRPATEQCEGRTFYNRQVRELSYLHARAMCGTKVGYSKRTGRPRGVSR